MLVECKRYSENRRVGPEPITRLWFRLFDDKANMAMVVTTSSFQPVAQETAKSRGYQISLKEGDDFIQWIKSLRTN
jgi:restriction endonuclease Mrr